MTDTEIKYMAEALVADLAEMLSEDFGYGVAESLDILYNSVTYSKLMEPKTGLYFQSAGYVYSFLKKEIIDGKID